MSTVYNPESELITQIERLELESRDIRRRLEKTHGEADQKVLKQQLEDIRLQIDYLRGRLP